MALFCPLDLSLSDDAPGYTAQGSLEQHARQGAPRCYRCSGSGLNAKFKVPTECKACRGKGFIMKISKRLTAADDEEQLSILTGGWKLYQKKNGHKWTTDDIMTAWCACFFLGKESNYIRKPTRTLDLGCGNGSVLSMVASYFRTATCIGIEARSEAISLARKSIAYNCGADDTRVTVRNADFRRIYTSIAPTDSSVLPEGAVFDLVTGTPPYFRVNFDVDRSRTSTCGASGAVDTAALSRTSFQDATTEKLVEVGVSTDGGNVTSASSNSSSSSGSSSAVPTTGIIRAVVCRQGALPTNKDSAPARCEFRGGIEAYCLAAAVALAPPPPLSPSTFPSPSPVPASPSSPNGQKKAEEEEQEKEKEKKDIGAKERMSRFVVCENWLNHERVLRAAEEAGLDLVWVHRVRGKVGHVTPLFAVYTMVLPAYSAIARVTLASKIESGDGGDACHKRSGEVVGKKMGVVNGSNNHQQSQSEATAGAAAAAGTAAAGTAAAGTGRGRGTEEMPTTADSSPIYYTDVSVRDSDGAWTVEYAAMLSAIGYPVRCLHPSGRY